MRDKLVNASLRGVATCVPGKVVTLDELYSGYNDAESVKQLKKAAKLTPDLGGRHVVNSTTTAMDLANRAASHLLETLRWDPLSIDVIITSTVEPDALVPSAGYNSHKLLGLSSNCMVIDTTLTCGAFVTALWFAAGLLTTGTFKRALILFGDALSTELEPKDLLSRAMFCDAGSAIAMEHTPNRTPISFICGVDVSGLDTMTLLGRGYRQNQESPYLSIDGLKLGAFFYGKIPALLDNLACFSNTPIGEVDYLFLHQPNQFMRSALLSKIGIPEQKAPSTQYGNCGGSTIPAIICDNWSSRERTPLSIYICGFGAGYSWGALHMMVDELITLPVIIEKDL